MNREEAEERIKELLTEVGRIAKEYGTKDYLTATIRIESGEMHFNNEYWGDDEGHPLKSWSFRVDFGEGKDL